MPNTTSMRPWLVKRPSMHTMAVGRTPDERPMSLRARKGKAYENK